MLKDSPLVSIIIPIFNVFNYIEDCLQSVMNQTYRNIEILCIDDCGADDSIKIVENYAEKDTRIKILRHSENKGLAPARNFGISEAKGHFIFFLDSDDYLSRTAIQELLINAHTSKADITLCDSKAFLDSRYNHNPEINNYIDELNTYLTASFDNLSVTEKNYYSSLKEVSCVAWAKLFKTQFIKDNDLKFVDRKVFHEDNGFHAKFLACNPYITCVHKKLYFYRIRANSITQNVKNEVVKAAHLKISIQDAISFIQNSKNPALRYELQDYYYSLFLTENCFMKYYWGKKRKLLKIIGIFIINYTVKVDNTKKLAILGIRFV